MKKYIIIHILLAIGCISVNADADWSENYFPYDTAALASGGTFTSSPLSQRLSPALAISTEFGATTAFVQDVHVYYIAASVRSFSFDAYYYRWGSEEWRDSDGTLLGEYYAGDYSFAAGYNHRIGAFNPALQIRVHYKEIGAVSATAFRIAPSVTYAHRTFLGGISWIDPTDGIWAVFGAYDLGYARLSLRTDYDNDFIPFFGSTFFLTSQRNATLALGLYDGHFSTGFSLTKNTITFHYALLLHNAGLTTHSFGITFSPTR